MKKIYFLIFGLLLLLNVPQKGLAQISISSTTPVTENFDGMGNPGNGAIASTLPTNWRVASGTTPVWSGGTTATTQTANSGSPNTGGTYNWGTTAGTDRALGFLTSGSFSSPNSVIAFYQNTATVGSISSLSVKYDLEKYRTGTTASSVAFYYSTDGSTWINITAGGISLSADADATTYTFGTPVVYNPTTNPFIVTFGAAIPTGGNFYLMWTITNPGSTNSKGLGLDNVSVTPTFSNSISTSTISGAPFCVSPAGAGNFGAAVSVPYTISGTYAGTNTFTAQLSDATGSFAAPVNIGTIANTNIAGTITATIPASTPAGTGYRMRVISSNPTTVPANIIANTVDQTVNVFNAPTAFNVDHGNTTAQCYWVNPSCFSEVMIVATSGSFTGALPTGDGTAYTASLDYTSATSSTFDGGKVVYKGTGTLTTDVIDLTNFLTYNFKIFIRSGTTWVAGATLSTVPQPPVITLSTTTLPGFNYVVGSGPSASLTYTVTGTGLQSDITLTAPTDYEISINNSTFISSLVLTADASQNVATTTIYIRLKAGLAVGNYNSEIIAATSLNASAKNLSCSGTVYKQEPTNYPTSFTATCASVTASSIPLSWTNSTGTYIPDGYLIKWSTTSYAAITDPVDGTAEASGANEQNVVNGSGIYTPAGLAANTTYYFNIYPYTNSGTAINYKTSASIPHASCTTSDVPCLTEGFNAAPSAPSGWTFIGSGFSTYTSAGNFGASSPSLQFNASTQQVKTIALSSGSSAYILSFWLKGQTSTGSSFLVEGFNGTSWVTIQNITTIPNTATVYVYNFTGSSPALPANLTQFRFTYTKVTSNVAFDDVSVYCTTNCSSPDAIAFVQQPSNVLQGSAMAPAVTVKAYCIATGNTATGFTGPITLTAIAPGCGYVSQVASAVNGIATFNNIIFTRSPQSGVTLQASASSITATTVTSNTFNVTAPGGSPTNTLIATNLFDGSGTWTYGVGTPTYSGTGGTANGDLVAIKTFGGNPSLVKSYTADNGSGQIRSTNTITFANQTGLAAYNYTTFSFQVGSLGTGTGAGADGGDNMNIDISLDGGTTWSTLLTYIGNSDYLFPLSSTTPVSLVYNANATYVKASTQSAFNVVLPYGTSQFRFRMTATNNRTQENWAIDNISLVGTTIPAGVSNALPTATGNTITTCPSTGTSISVATANTVGTVTYAWTPANGTLSSTTVANPVVTTASSATYTCTITDADKCSTSATVAVTIPTGTAGSWTGITNSDWFECTNWGDGVVPTSGTIVTVPTTPANSVMIDPTSTFATPFSGIASASAITNNQTIALQSGAILNVGGNVTNASTGLIDMTNGGTIDLKGIWTNNAGTSGFTAGVGKVSFSGSGIQGINTTGASESFYDLTVNNSNGVVMNSNVNIADITALTAGPIFINGKTLTMNGVVNTGTGTLSGSATSNVTIGNTGGTNPTLNFTSGSQILHNLTLNSGALATLGTALAITAGSAFGTDSVANGATLTTNNNLTLKSDANGTARIAQNTSGTNYITGNVSIERFETGFRAWRFLTAPLSSTTQNVNTAWQEGKSNVSVTSPVNSVPAGYGTEITLSTSPASYILGYDQGVTANPSLFYYNNATHAYGVLPATNTGLITNWNAYMLFVRGDRTFLITGPSYNPSNTTVLRTYGSLNMGNITTPILPVGFCAVGNPYASSINFTNVAKSAGISGNLYLWDPHLATTTNNYGVGAFVTLTPSGGSYFAVPDPTTSGAGYTGHPFDIDGTIQSGSAFMVNVVSGSSNSLTFHETDKSVITHNYADRPAYNGTPDGSVRATLYAAITDSTSSLADGVLSFYSPAYSDSVNLLEDVAKATTFSENLGILRDGKLLSVERRQPVNVYDTTFFNLTRLGIKKYIYEFITSNMDKPGLVGLLMDSYAHTATPVNLNGTTDIVFNTDNNAASRVSNRFMLVFGPPQGGPLPVTFTSVKAAQKNKNIAVQWNVTNEVKIKQYEVLKSTDGKSFTQVATVKATGANQYNWLDENAVSGENYYRIKSVGSNGTVSYTEIVKVKIGVNNPEIAVYPNPVKDGVLGLQFTNMPAGIYDLHLTNTLGQVLVSKSIQHPGGSASQTISITRSAAKGVYTLEVTNPDNTKTTFKVLYQ